MTARSDIDERLIEQALAWQATLERDDADWDGYIAWLEADPRHRDAFDAVALVDATVAENRQALGDLLEAQRPVVTPSTFKLQKWFLGAGAGIAAALALFVAVPMMRTPEAATAYSAEAGQSRSISLANGTAVTLSPASRIVVHGKDAGRIELASGEAYFDVKHDPGRTLMIEAGGYRISDIGTRFSVNVGDGTFRIGVSEGKVSVASVATNQRFEVAAGHQLTGWADAVTLAPVASAQVASWRNGALSYDKTPLPLVARDISRYSGRKIIVDPSLEKQNFSGTLVIGDGSKLASDMATIMGAEARPEGAGIRISANRH